MVPTDTQVTGQVTTQISWVKHHLILLAFIIIFFFGGVYFVVHLLANNTAANDARWQQVLAAQQQQTQLLETKLTADEKTRSDVQAQQQAIIVQLATAMVQRNTAVEKQRQADATLSAVDAAQRLSQLTQAKAGEVTAQGDNIIMDLPIGRTVVASLDLLPVVQADLIDTQNQLGAETKIANGATSMIEEQKMVISSITTLSGIQSKACTAQVNDLKAQARKSKLKIGAIGYVAGFLSAIGLRIAGI